jgi:hypothetical protein
VFVDEKSCFEGGSWRVTSDGQGWEAATKNCGCAISCAFGKGSDDGSSEYNSPPLHRESVTVRIVQMTRSVWLFARPLSWADFIIALQWVSDGKYPLCHWGVLVTHLDITANDEFMRRTPDISSTEALDLGIMYELRRNDINQNTVNIIRPFSTAASEWRVFSAKYIGTTEMVHEEIEVEGTVS